MRTNEFLKSFPPEKNDWTGKVTFSFGYPHHGWIQFAVTCTTYVQASSLISRRPSIPSRSSSTGWRLLPRAIFPSNFTSMRKAKEKPSALCRSTRKSFSSKSGNGYGRNRRSRRSLSTCMCSYQRNNSLPNS